MELSTMAPLFTDAELDEIMEKHSGAFSWYRSYASCFGGIYVVRMDTPDRMDGKAYTFSRADVRRTITEIMNGEHGLTAEDREDFLCSATLVIDMDSVIQICAYGHVAFS